MSTLCQRIRRPPVRANGLLSLAGHVLRPALEPPDTDTSTEG